MSSLRVLILSPVVSTTFGYSLGLVGLPRSCTRRKATQGCPCGYYGSGHARCTCHTAQVQRYMNRVSGPMLDRIDLHIDVPTLDARALTHMDAGESSLTIRARVLAARDRQLERQGFANAHMSVRQVREICVTDEKSVNLLRRAITKLGLSARAYHRVLRLARTIADLEGTESIKSSHIAEAIQYRTLDRVPVA